MTEDENALAGRLIERLLVDPVFRAEFRRDPAGACVVAGLPGLAGELGGGGGMETLELRESRSSLAGVVMAAAVEGLSVAEAQAFVEHGVRGLHGVRVPGRLGHGVRVPSEVQKVRGLEHRAVGRVHRLEHEVRAAGHGAGPGSQGSPSGSSAASSGGSGASPGASSAEPAGAHAAGGSPAASQAAGGSPAAAGGSPVASAASASAPSAGAPAAAGPAGSGSSLPWPDAPSPGAGAGGLAGNVVGSMPAGGAGAGVGAVVGGGAGPQGLSGLLEAPGLQASPQVRAFLASGGVDPRVVSVLDTVLAHHSVGVADVVSTSSPVHVQAIDIVSVDGQPVGPENFAARDLVTEIAAMDSGVRPDEIGTPWPIQSPGFFSDQTSQGSLHLAFEMPGANSGASAASVVPGAAAPGAVPGAAAPGAVPGAAVPGAAASVVDPSVAPAPGAPAANVVPSTAPAGTAPAGVTSAATPGGGAPAGTALDAATAGSGAPAGDPNFASPTAHAAFEAAHKELGVPYLYGGESPQAGFDCSGLMQWAYHQAGINLPRVADQQFTVGTSVGLNDLKEGDLVFFRIGGGDVDHVGMYVGNHMFLEAPRTGEVVQMADLRNSYWSSQFAGARRVVPLSGAGLSQAASAPGAGTAAPAGTAPVDPTAAPVTTLAVDPAAATPATPAVDPATATPAAGATPVAGATPADAGATPVPGGASPTAADPSAAVPGVSGTAQFQAVGGHGPHHKLNTVKFLQAVQPSPGSPLAQTAGAGAPGGVDPTAAPGQAVPGQPVADQLQGQPGTAPAGTTAAGLGDQALSQAAAPGSVVSVSSSLLTKGQQIFVAHLASATGLNTRVVAGWVLAEESGSAAQGREAASNFNWLNIGYFDSGTGAIAHASPFGDPVSAAEQTAKFLKGQWGGASTGIQDILHTVGKPPEDQIMAIANSGWASSHYNNGANLRATFEELSDMKIVNAPAPGAGLAIPSPGTPIT